MDFGTKQLRIAKYQQKTMLLISFEVKNYFRVILKPDPEDGGFNVSCPALPREIQKGDAIGNIKDAIITGCLEAFNQRARVHDMTEKLVDVAVA